MNNVIKKPVILTICLTIIVLVAVFNYSDDGSNSYGVGKTDASALEKADYNNDNIVNIQDLSILLGKWGANDPSVDLNNNNIVNIIDLSILLSRWGPVATSSVEYPRVASVYQNSGESWAQSCIRTMSYGYNGCVRYLPAGTTPSWDSQFQSLAASIGSKEIYIQLTAKTHTNAGLENFLQNIPQAWKKGFIYNIYQEPEDNLLDATSQAQYRNSYTDAATVTRRYNVSLPWVEWQEWTVDPLNNKGWNLANFTPPSGDFGGVLWSLFEYNEKGVNNLNAQISRIQNAMQQYAPGKPWGLMASAYTLENPPYTDAQKQAQAQWVEQSYIRTKNAGSKLWAWFNLYWPGSGGASGEARIEENSYALDALNRVKDL